MKDNRDKPRMFTEVTRELTDEQHLKALQELTVIDGKIEAEVADKLVEFEQWATERGLHFGAVLCGNTPERDGPMLRVGANWMSETALRCTAALMAVALRPSQAHPARANPTPETLAVLFREALQDATAASNEGQRLLAVTLGDEDPKFREAYAALVEEGRQRTNAALSGLAKLFGFDPTQPNPEAGDPGEENPDGENRLPQ